MVAGRIGWCTGRCGLELCSDPVLYMGLASFCLETAKTAVGGFKQVRRGDFRGARSEETSGKPTIRAKMLSWATRRHRKQAAERKRELCRAGARFFLVLAANEEFGDLHQIVGQNGDADECAEAVVAASQTTLHSPAAEEHGNAAFNAGAEPLRLFELRSFFKSLTFSRFLSAALRNAGASDTGFAANLLVVGAIKATIGGENFRSGAEGLLVTTQRGAHMVFIGRITVQDAVLSD